MVAGILKFMCVPQSSCCRHVLHIVSLALQIAQSRSSAYTLGPKVSILDVFESSGGATQFSWISVLDGPHVLCRIRFKDSGNLSVISLAWATNRSLAMTRRLTNTYAMGFVQGRDAVHKRPIWVLFFPRQPASWRVQLL